MALLHFLSIYVSDVLSQHNFIYFFATRFNTAQPFQRGPVFAASCFVFFIKCFQIRNKCLQEKEMSL